MPADKQRVVELRVEIPENTWQTLVEYSQSMRHDTVAKTVLLMLYPTLETFLRGKSAGITEGVGASSEALSRALDKVLPPQAQEKQK